MSIRGREIWIITAVVAIVLIVAWYFLLFSPKRQELSDLDEQISSAQTALATATQEVATLESYKKTAPQSRAEIVRLGKMVPESEGTPGIMVELLRCEKESGAQIRSITRGEYVPGNPFGTQKISVMLRGRYFDMEDFLYRIEQFVAFRNTSFHVTGRLLQVSSLIMSIPTIDDIQTTIEVNTSTSGLLEATVELVGYTYGVSAPASTAPSTTTTSTTTTAATGGAQ